MRSASSISQLSYPTSTSVFDQYVNPAVRRNVSGPAVVSYHSARRPQQSPVLRAAGSGRASPLEPTVGAMRRSGSALIQEVIEISSSDDGDDDDDREIDLSDGDEESEDGVRVDIRSGEGTGYVRARRPVGRR